MARSGRETDRVKRIAILGSTGSIGQSALAVVDAHADRLQVVGLAAGENAELLAAQIARYRPRVAAMATGGAVDRLARSGACRRRVRDRRHRAATASSPWRRIPTWTSCCARRAAPTALEAVLAAIEHGKTIALANKEVLVMAGGIVTEAARAPRRRHPARRQRAQRHPPVPARPRAVRGAAPGADGVGRTVPRAARRLILEVTAADALKHPTWRMGRKITIDSATLMNKGLEVIEAHWLFGVRADQIDVVIHPQSVVHSMVELVDGSIIAQLGVTDMRLPIQYAFSYPERWPAPLPSLDLARAGRLDFDAPDTDAFPCLRLAYRALEAERSLPVVLNAANEVAVARFLDGRIGFTSIPRRHRAHDGRARAGRGGDAGGGARRGRVGPRVCSGDCPRVRIEGLRWKSEV